MSVQKVRGAEQLRTRLICATLAGITMRVDNIREREESPGLRLHEASVLRLIEKVTNGCTVEINETGTRLKYKPGVVIGGSGLFHDCGTSRAIGYFVEPLIILALFGKKALSITLQGITNDDKDSCVDTLRTTTLPLLKRFGVTTEGLELKILKRGAPPLGGGEVLLKVPTVTKNLTAINWTDEGMVKRVRGVAYATRVSPQMANRMVDSARGVLNRLLADVYIFTDHYKGNESGKSPGYGLSLLAETTTGCLISAERAAVASRDADAEPRNDERSGGGLVLPEDVGSQAAQQLLEEVKAGGVVDFTHQGLLLLLCALCPEDVSKVRLGRLSPNAIRTLRTIKEFLGVQFNIQAEPSTGTVMLSCVGSGCKNLSRKIT
ncbi:hypothetical protein CBR_g11105 [Chara braunii]|uniref:RNA 3'-terminal phosphate cyclase domain-containing protein n=1 Tax=Chara braunii TaxID=69332 RepID=A0A388KQ62_CHABU|nr:hypothetical protein CBR_g11105 [Chara braunii]|eukprot:GBG72172.1 hypothetical protein CBR_g11105 [Chara braunii]